MQIANEILSTQIKKHKTPGLQYLFFNQDSIIYSYSGGKANLDTHVEVTDKTTFNAYSVTKTFIAPIESLPIQTWAMFCWDRS